MKFIFKIYIIVFTLFTGKNMISQGSDIYTSQTKLLIQSVDIKGTPFVAYTESAYMNLSLSTGEFLLKADMADIKTGDRTIDSLISTKGPQPFNFHGKITENLLIFGETAIDDKHFNLEGQLTINNLTLNCVAQYNPANFGEKSETKAYRMDFKLSVDPAKITILGLENKLSKQLVFDVTGGLVNTKP